MDDIKQYWRSLEEYDGMTPQESGQEKLQPEKEFLAEDLALEETSDKPSRRDFLKMLGFTVGYAALANSCEMPVRKAIPYLSQPEEITPGIANYYASTFFDGHDYCSILVKTREGRPIKIEGNALSKLTQGGTNARVQASVLSLYDQARLKEPLKDNQNASWQVIDQEVTDKLKAISGNNGKIVILSPTIISPSSRKAIEDFKAAYPTTEWVVYDTVSAAGLLDANEANFGIRAIPSYHFDKAALIVGFNADFLGNWILPVQYSRDYAKGRKLINENKMSRHIHYESCLTLTGSNADTRVQIKPSEELIVLLSLFNELAGENGMQPVSVASSPVDVKTLAKELKENKGKSLVVSGTNDFYVQAAVNSINILLENYGTTLDMAPVMLKQGSDREMARVVNEMNAGTVSALFLYGVNPAYDYAEPEVFMDGLKKCELTVSFSDTLDETALLCKYVCPDHHYLESWNDAEPQKNYYSLAQPVINNLFDTRQAQVSLLKWTGQETGFYEFIQAYWEKEIFPKQTEFLSFIQFWNKSLQDGVALIDPGTVTIPEFKASDLSLAPVNRIEGIELVLYEKIGLGTGRHANNPWLQELPDPISKAVWDNYVCVAPSFAKEHELKNEDVVLINRSIELPVLVQPGQHKDTIGIAIGYGRTNAGKVADGIGKNVFSLALIMNGYRQLAGRMVTIEKVNGKTYPLATTQTHHTMEGRAIIRETTLEQWNEDPMAGNEMHEEIMKQNQTLYNLPVFDSYHWSMAINLNACIGCGNCAIACQAENNIAVIGKEQVKNRRIMHWIRIDRYYSEEVDNPEVTHMPVMCQHCDNAPCENVCPVAATPHSSEGLNQMAYNRCIGTRYCMNNCPFRVRRFNWFEYTNEKRFNYNMGNEQEKLVLNPDVTVRSRGVVEKCSMCIQRIQEQKLNAKLENHMVREGDIKTACQQSCPGDAIVFGDINDPNSEVAKLNQNPRTYQLLEQLHTLPSVSYITKVRNMDPKDKKRNYSINYPTYSSGETLPDEHQEEKH
ncbi:MAG: TAT-variant-translocated molybdopterin oxidoreductase [Bacteroidales bacterium]|nr:TAT-variant-translocated molybdopterin oxidoreductase [Bacteroidales bacterium]